LALALAIPILMLALRIFGHGDLHRKDQPRTVSYTADIVANGHWLLPYDCEGVPTQKPPVYNWLGAPLLRYLPPEEWVLKLPTIASFFAILGMLWAFTRRQLGALPAGFAVAAFSINTSVFVLAYTARPDMLLSAWILGALLLVLHEQPGVRHWRFFLAWVLVACAALTKGPAALLVPCFILARAALIPNFRRHWALRLLAPGLLLSAVLVAAWAVPAWNAYPASARASLVAAEQARVGGHWFREFVTGMWKMPFYFVARFLPWSIAVVWALIRWRKINLPDSVRIALLWIGLVIVFFTFPAMKRDDYLLPALPMAAFVAAWFTCEVARRFPQAQAVAVASAIACLLGRSAYELTLRNAPEDRHGDAQVAFAHQILKTTHGEKIAFVHTGYHALQALLGHNQAAVTPSRTQWEAASWVVMQVPQKPGLPPPLIVSDSIPQVIRRSIPATLGLWRKSDLTAQGWAPEKL